MNDEHTLMITVANRVGVLAGIAGALSSRGYNIRSIIGWQTEDPDVYRVHLVTRGTGEQIEQISKQIQKLIDTYKVVDVPHNGNSIIHEFALIKIRAYKNRGEILDLTAAFGGKVVGVTRTCIFVDLSGPTERIDQFIDLMGPFGIKECVRSGRIAVSAYSVPGLRSRPQPAL